MNTIQKELQSRKSEIKKELELLFKTNMKITDWDVPEVDDNEVAYELLKIFEETLHEIKVDIEAGQYNNY